MDEALFGEKPVLAATCFEIARTNEVGIVLHLFNMFSSLLLYVCPKLWSKLSLQMQEFMKPFIFLSCIPLHVVELSM